MDDEEVHEISSMLLEISHPIFSSQVVKKYCNKMCDVRWFSFFLPYSNVQLDVLDMQIPRKDEAPALESVF